MTSQNDKAQLEKAKEMTYLKGFNEGVRALCVYYVGICVYADLDNFDEGLSSKLLIFISECR